MNGTNARMYEWEFDRTLRVSVRNPRIDRKISTDTRFLVEARFFYGKGSPTQQGILMAWHNCKCRFIHHRAEQYNRIREMRMQTDEQRKRGTVLITDQINSNAYTLYTTAITICLPLPIQGIQDAKSNNSCVIFMDN
ncbi:unnamed protein product [Didymodactylos carnosus]|uniref:Uncharacterized protein n=1 Tax=Didymodactylos carnosus TaxID=1234261 RepID=A0A813TC87_9BILA|nr:unnamed protein product [Didymodactylos carnosus]CAF0942864.1 unnamed protein product [Didymodactylos carnosus]CAF3598268.1 unnamed protein product [Didymodactylos carnosus]CAF3717759.1 unnamed protein product [Didymodactylos carnosus]